jgi:nucleotide-binding universal stress UspA family protein
MLMPTKILVPTDFSDPSDKALEQALDYSKTIQREGLPSPRYS